MRRLLLAAANDTELLRKQLDEERLGHSETRVIQVSTGTLM